MLSRAILALVAAAISVGVAGLPRAAMADQISTDTATAIFAVGENPERITPAMAFFT